MNVKLFVMAAGVFLALPFAVSAQGVVVDASVAVGAAVTGLLGADQRSRFRAYVKHEHRISYAYSRPVTVGARLPAEGVTTYEVPSEYGVRNYRFMVVNDQTVLVDPNTHRIVQVAN